MSESDYSNIHLCSAAVWLNKTPLLAFSKLHPFIVSFLAISWVLLIISVPPFYFLGVCTHDFCVASKPIPLWHPCSPAGSFFLIMSWEQSAELGESRQQLSKLEESASNTTLEKRLLDRHNTLFSELDSSP